MGYLFSLVLLPAIFIFGLYHLLGWFNVLAINDKEFWRRVALTSSIAHCLLASGFFLAFYYNYQSNELLLANSRGFESILFNSSEFWRLMLIFDIVPTGVVLILFASLERFDISMRGELGVTMLIVYFVGTAQWYWLGGGLGMILQKIWDGLKRQEDDLDWLR